MPQRTAPAAAEGLHWEAMMQAAITGDERAYRDLLRAILPMLRAIARKRIANPAEAEDAVQDTLLTIHTLRHSYDPTRPLRPWLVALCERRCVDRLRRSGRIALRHAPIEDCDERALHPSIAASREPEAETRLAGAEVREAVLSLPRVQREAITLTKLQGLSLVDASAASGLSVGALKVATHRAVQTLRRRLGTAGQAMTA